jgi:hypothetical protein
MRIRRGFVIASFLVLWGLPFPLAAQSGPGETAAGEAPAEPAVEAASGEAGAEAAAETEAAGEDGGEAPVEEAAVEAAPADPAAKIREMDIKTSSLRELADWCRSLGLSEGGSREELARRLREHFMLAESGIAEVEENRKMITIESARSTQYFTLDVVDEEYARLRGEVVLSLKDDDASHRISAQEILYNRTRNQVTARGNVSYVKEEGNTVETFRGDSITVNLDSWATVLTGGISERALSGEQTTYRFAGTVISRSEEEVTILKNAKITNVSTPNSYWSLNASKLWLLPGSDFALRNAVLKVGEIPLLYIPFFYYPADEVIFHPVLGYRSREGNFVQTTTYLIGRPKPEDLKESSLTKILGSGAGMEKERQGIFLRSTGKQVSHGSDASLKLLFDFYTNLGLYFGVDMKTPSLGILRNFDLSAGIGRTRDVMPKVLGGLNSFTPYPNLDGESQWNSSRLFSQDIPLRYRLKTSGSLSGRAGELSWELPHYSDPFVDRDFLNRAEAMDWFRIIQEGASMEDQAAETTTLTSYEWRLNGRISSGAPKILAPYITTLSFSNFSSTMLFNSRNSAEYANRTYSPNSQFYIPDKFTVFSVGMNVGGTPLTLNTGGRASPPPAPRTEAPGEEAGDPLKGIGLPRSPWGIAEDTAGEQAGDPWNLSPPALAQRFDLSRGGGPQFSIDYRLNPAAVSELQFRTGVDPLTGKNHWPEAKDVDWTDVSSVLATVRGDAHTSFNFNHLSGLYTNVFGLSFSGAFQDYFYANHDAEEFNESTPAATANEIRNALARVYGGTFFTTSYDYTGTIRPVYWDPVWGTSNFSYSFKGLLAKTEYDSNSIPQGPSVLPDDVWNTEPKWDIKYGAWDKEHVDSHQLSANINANVMDLMQNLSINTILPPKDPVLSGSATARIWWTEFTTSTQVLEPWDREKRKPEPLNFTATLKFGPQGTLGSLQQYMVYDPKDREYRTLTTRLNFWGFSAGFTATHGIPYEFVYDPTKTSGNGWVQSGSADLHPQELRFGFSKSAPGKTFWEERISLAFSVNSNLLIDLQRYTYSKFDASLRFTLGIKEFLDLSFSATSENAMVYRYLRRVPAFQLPIPAIGEENVFKDLLNSFRFDDEQLRTESGFKLKSLNLEAVHHMGDWNATLGVSLFPYLEQPGGGTPYYKFNTQISFLIQWLPINEIKSELKIDKDKWTLK